MFSSFLVTSCILQATTLRDSKGVYSLLLVSNCENMNGWYIDGMSLKSRQIQQAEVTSIQSKTSAYDIQVLMDKC